MERKLKAWLQRNPLTADESDFTAVVESFGSIAPSGVIKELVAEGMELKPETVLDVVTRYNRKCIEMVLRGYSVNAGIVLMRPIVKGAFYDKTWNPDRNRLYVSITQGADLRAAVAETTVDIMGEHPDPMALFNITDLSTGSTVGTITRGFNAELKGTYIKVAGDNPACGIYFRNMDTTVETKLDPQYISINDPSRILIIVPATLAEGVYELRITTQFSNHALLNQPRSISLPYMVEIV